MPAGNTVRPRDWTNVIDLYDNGVYSAIWGNYCNSPNRQLGVRWNNDPNPVGFPNHGANPTWFVEPDFLTKMVLLNLYFFTSKNSAMGDLGNILTALNESP